MVTFESKLEREKNVVSDILNGVHGECGIGYGDILYGRYGECGFGYGDILNGRYGECGIKKMKGG